MKTSSLQRRGASSSTSTSGCSNLASVALQRRHTPFVACPSAASGQSAASRCGHASSSSRSQQQQWLVRGPPQQCSTTSRSDVRVRATKTEKEQQFFPKTAREAIETATRLQNEKRDYEEAVRLYVLAMEMQPNDDEARAALYNMGCALAKQKQWANAVECISKAVNKYSLKLSVALKDDDLRELRDRREWIDALVDMKGGLSRSAKIELRSEARAPFRFPRIVLFGGLGIGAALGLVIISLRLVAALKGGEGAPDLQETLQNFGINSVAVAVLGWLVWRDLQSKEKAVKVTEREEVLGRLQIDLGGARQLPLLRLRGQIRPVIVSGSRAFVESAIRAASKYQDDLRERGVSVVPVILDEVEAARRAVAMAAPLADPDAKIKALKKEFAQLKDTSGSKGFGGSAAPAAAEGAPAASTSPQAEGETVALVESDKKWRLVPYNIIEWKEWLDGQKEFASLPKDARDIYVQVQLDGTVRSSGRGMPDWFKFVGDLPPLDSVRTRFTDGIGSTEV